MTTWVRVLYKDHFTHVTNVVELAADLPRDLARLIASYAIVVYDDWVTDIMMRNGASLETHFARQECNTSINLFGYFVVEHPMSSAIEELTNSRIYPPGWGEPYRMLTDNDDARDLIFNALCAEFARLAAYAPV